MITLYHATAGTVTLPDPKFGDNIVTELDMVVKSSTMGKPIVVANNNLDILRTLQFSIEEVSATVFADLQTFLDATAGLEIIVTTHLGEVWEVWVTEEPTFTESNRNTYSFQLTITGEKSP